MRAAATAVMRAALDELAGRGWGDPLRHWDSGSGEGVFFLAADGVTRADWQAALTGLAARHGNPAAGIDRSTHNPSRVNRVAGLLNTKGAEHRPCRLLAGDPPLVQPITREMLAEVAGSPESRVPFFDQPPREYAGGDAPAGKPDRTLPGDDFNARGDWFRDYLDLIGAKKDRTDSHGVVHVTRPGKDEGTSATLGHFRSRRDGSQMLFVFSDAWDGLQPWKPVDPFGAVAYTFYKGDLRRAAAELRKKGSGSPLKPGGIRLDPTGRPPAADEAAEGGSDSPAGDAAPAEPLPVRELPEDAGRLARSYLTPDDNAGPPRLFYWRQDYWHWDGCRYVKLDAAAVEAAVWAHIYGVFRADHEREVRGWVAKGDAAKKQPVLMKMTRTILTNALNAIRSMGRVLPSCRDMPCWLPLDGPADRPGPPGRRLLPERAAGPAGVH